MQHKAGFSLLEGGEVALVQDHSNDVSGSIPMKVRF